MSGGVACVCACCMCLGAAGNELGGVAVEPAPQSRVDLADMVLDQPVQLRLEVRVVVHGGKLHQLGQFAVDEALVDAPHGLVPHELDGIAAAGQLGANVPGPGDRRAVRADEVLGYWPDLVEVEREVVSAEVPPKFVAAADANVNYLELMPDPDL